MKFTVLKAAPDVGPFVKAAQSCADAEKGALGFLPQVAYSEAAAAGKLFVAVLKSADGLKYAGHLLFGGSYPHIRVFQIQVIPALRRRKVASLLIQSLIKDAEDKGYLSISAKVAADLVSANAFYASENFSIARCMPGGPSRGRTLNVRVRELDTPTLFGLRWNDLAENDAEIPSIVSSAIPSYTIDVNVFLDLMKNRANAEEVRRLIAASLTRAVDVFVSDEFVEELRRAGDPLRQDSILQFASALPRLPKIPKSVVDPILDALGPIVFPDKTRRQSLAPRDISDLVHLATVIHHRLTGFVTGEKAILRRAPELRQQFGIDVSLTCELSGRINR